MILMRVHGSASNPLFQALGNLVDQSSRYATTCSKPLITSLITFINQPGDALLPWAITSHSQKPVGVRNAVSGTVSLWAVFW